MTNIIQGITDVFFELMYGTQEDLHNKAIAWLTQLFSLPLDPTLTRALRFLMVKLFSQIDSSKQLPLFVCIQEELVQTDDLLKLKLSL